MRKPKYLNTRLMGCTKEETKKDTLEYQTCVQLSTLKDIKETKPYQKKKRKIEQANIQKQYKTKQKSD